MSEKTHFAKNLYTDWYQSSLEYDSTGYHIIQDGILNKKDYALLFETSDGKYHIPPEVLNQMNFYGNVEISPSVRTLLAENNIQLNFYDKYGRLISTSIPNTHCSGAYTVINQCRTILDEKSRLYLAKKMEDAAISNIRSNIRYYVKKQPELSSIEAVLTEAIKRCRTSSSISQLLLIEAYARQNYYSAFNTILKDSCFQFISRTKNPPGDPLNALISFGNSLLYSEFQKLIQMTSLDIRFGIIHSSDRRCVNLNLDFADIYKPIITDRIIFSLVNHRQLPSMEESFIHKNSGVFLSEAGKRIFIQEYNKKLNTSILHKDQPTSYRSLMKKEVMSFFSYINGKASCFHPYKYY